MSWPTTAADFDVYLLDSSGAEVGSSASSSDPEVIQVPPNAGRYTVRIVPFAPAGQSTSTDISLVPTPGDPPVSSAPTSGFRTFPAPASLPDAHNAGEPSLGFDRRTGKALYQAYLSTYRVGFTDSATTTTATYVDKSASAATGCPVGSTQSLDPILATDKRTGQTIESQLLDLRGAGSLSCVTGNDGDTWATSQGGGFNSGVDHQTLGWGPYAPGGVAAARTFPSELYYCAQDIADASCSTSTDGGTTFGPAVPIYNLTRCGGLHGHVKVAPDGTAYVPNKSCDGHPAVVVSVDNGLHWAIRPVPAGSPGESDPSVALAADGTVYLSWNGANNHAYTAVSRDRGETWTAPYDVGAQLGIQNVAFPAAVAGVTRSAPPSRSSGRRPAATRRRRSSSRESGSSTSPRRMTAARPGRPPTPPAPTPSSAARSAPVARRVAATATCSTSSTPRSTARAGSSSGSPTAAPPPASPRPLRMPRLPATATRWRRSPGRARDCGCTPPPTRCPTSRSAPCVPRRTPAERATSRPW